MSKRCEGFDGSALLMLQNIGQVLVVDENSINSVKIK